MKIAAEQKKVSEANTSELVFTDTLGKGKDFAVNETLYKLLGAEKLNVTNALLGGMINALDSFVQEELTTRDLSTLKTHFL